METMIHDMTAHAIAAAGIRICVVSPGARNSALIQAFADAGLEMVAVADERVAAFVALGMAAETGCPVSLLCTSGTALLNYAPALAEALYRHIPLVAVTADRPALWIDRADSQTLRQPGALASVVKRSVALPAASGAGAGRHSALLLDEALLAALSRPRGPVHVNIPVDFADGPVEVARRPPLTVVESDATISTRRIRSLGLALASPRKIMIVAGGGAPSPRLDKALSRLAALPNFVVVTEPTANVHCRAAIASAEATLIGVRPDMESRLRPDVVITIGGAIVSDRLKTFLRATPGLEHWATGGTICGSLPDTFGALTTLVDMDPEAFMPLLASAMQPHTAPSPFSDDWHVAARRGMALLQSAASRAPWSTLKAVTRILTTMPRRWNLQVSNGMNIRLACLAASVSAPWHRFDCNRGVSGIDGSTSTAIGASITYTAAPTMLVTGDMSALYDLSSLASGIVPPRFRMVVTDNGGGGIFRFSRATRSLPCRDRLIGLSGMTVPFRDMARGCGFDYLEASSGEELDAVWPQFTAAPSERPAMLRIVTDAATDSDTFNDYYHNTK